MKKGLELKTNPMKWITQYSVMVFPWTLVAQSGVTGSVPVTRTNGPADCNSRFATADVQVDITGHRHKAPNDSIQLLPFNCAWCWIGPSGFIAFLGGCIAVYV